jgi:hypothetical protein
MARAQVITHGSPSHIGSQMWYDITMSASSHHSRTSHEYQIMSTPIATDAVWICPCGAQGQEPSVYEAYLVAAGHVMENDSSHEVTVILKLHRENPVVGRTSGW